MTKESIATAMSLLVDYYGKDCIRGWEANYDNYATVEVFLNREFGYPNHVLNNMMNTLEAQSYMVYVRNRKLCVSFSDI